MYVVTSIPFVNRTRATFRSAEFGFFGARSTRPGNPTGAAAFRQLCPAYPFNLKGLRGAFQRGRLRTHFAFRRRLFPKLNCVFSGSSHALTCLRKPPGTGKPDLTRGTL